MKEFKIPVEWKNYGFLNIEAHSLEDALDIAKTGQSIALPDGDYIDGSFEVIEDEESIRCANEPMKTIKDF